MKTREITKALGVGAIVCIGLLAYPVDRATAEDTPDGAALYRKACANCHGADGRGDTPVGRILKVESLDDSKWKGTEAQAQIEKAIRDGVPGMPGAADKFTAAEITALARATQALSPGN